jgi:hypothetical protein
MRRLLTVLVVLLLTAGAASAQNQKFDGPFTDVPSDHWAYSVLDQLREKDLNVNADYGGNRSYGSRRALTRYEFAVATARMLERLATSEGEQKPGAEKATAFRINALRRLAEEFAPQMKTLGVSMSDVYVRLANREPFTDVPANHWAASSVDKLRKAGIVIGFPGGDF